MALIAVAADKGAPGVTTAAVALAAVWPRPVLLAECDPAGGDLIYRLPAAGGGRLDPRRGLLSLAVSVRRGNQASSAWEHAQKLHGGLDVLVGVASAEQGAGLEHMWDQVGMALSGLPGADVIADCGRLGPDGRYYDLLARAEAVLLVTRATLADLVRLRDRAAPIDAAIRGHGGAPGRLGVVVVADHRHFGSALGEVRQVLSGAACPVRVLGGLAHEPRSADLLSGEWGGKLDKTLLIRTARAVAADLSGRLQPVPPPGAPQPGRQLSGPPPAAAPQPRPSPAAGPPPGMPPPGMPPPGRQPVPPPVPPVPGPRHLAPPASPAPPPGPPGGAWAPGARDTARSRRDDPGVTASEPGGW